MSPPTDSLPTAQVDPAGAIQIQAAKAVFFDFDGPLCDVFSAYPAPKVAEALKEVARAFKVRLPLSLATSPDPHGILRDASLLGLRPEGTKQGSSFYAALERKLTQLETTAARGAEPTVHAAELIAALQAQGKRLLVTSNNAEGAVRTHLRARGLDGSFDHVVGRDPADPLLMKPDPYCVNLALELVGLDPADCLLLGDQPTDAEAARAAGVPFLGYAPDKARAAALREGGPVNMVASLDSLTAFLSQP